jgi:hypothetical protein
MVVHNPVDAFLVVLITLPVPICISTYYVPPPKKKAVVHNPVFVILFGIITYYGSSYYVPLFCNPSNCIFTKFLVIGGSISKEKSEGSQQGAVAAQTPSQILETVSPSAQIWKV